VFAPREVYTRDIVWMRKCDILSAEGSVPSPEAVYEIAFALHLGKPVLALYPADRRVSKMINGNLKSYSTLEEATLQIRKFLNPYKLCL
jgi:nucleoside 2-deoxyribosyltransferase